MPYRSIRMENEQSYFVNATTVQLHMIMTLMNAMYMISQMTHREWCDWFRDKPYMWKMVVTSVSLWDVWAFSYSTAVR